MAERIPELEHAEQQDREQRQDHRELDEALAAFAGTGSAPADHRIGSIRIVFDRTMVKPGPTAPMIVEIGVRQVCW